ncbi:MAG: TIGR03862 family flavoprotein, partial [Desulfobulbaceae bacterium]|nr:TIGR03862 family flavoprotein [Desulfobulbaceae bacterium]
MDNERGTVAVVGGGPAGLMAATVLCEAGLRVELFDAMPSVGRKLLVAGRGGFNLTNSVPPATFADQYGAHRPFFEKILARFSADDLRAWLQGMGIETRVGTSGRVFPVEATAADLLRTWLARLRVKGVTIRTGHRWLELTGERELLFRCADGSEQRLAAAGIVLALGGASWPKTGSDGSWTGILARHGIAIVPFQPSNCGFEAAWSETFASRFAGAPLKNLTLTTASGRKNVGELVITRHGLEGGGIYPLTPALREELAAHGQATLFLDLKRDLTAAGVEARLKRPRGKNSLANFLRKTLRLPPAAYSLLRECCPPSDFNDPSLLAARIKKLPVPLTAIRPIEEAISSAGGIAMTEIDDQC